MKKFYTLGIFALLAIGTALLVWRAKKTCSCVKQGVSASYEAGEARPCNAVKNEHQRDSCQ